MEEIPILIVHSGFAMCSHNMLRKKDPLPETYFVIYVS